MGRILLFFSVFVFAQTVLAQDETPILLDEVVLSDLKLRHFSEGVKVEVLNDSVLYRNPGSLTDNLRNNSPIYFKENGYGMVSSPSFRGTNAQQTAVVWNGININSQLNGQTDFNTLQAQNMDEISIRSGGGSTQYGTGAVGGTVHLNQRLHFDRDMEHHLSTSYGSYHTRNVFYKTSAGTEKIAFKAGLGHAASDNDYPYLHTDKRNENGAFSNYNLDMAVGAMVSGSDLINLYHSTFMGDRDFSGTLTAPSDDRYKDLNSRSLLAWNSFRANRVQRVKLAYLYERYRYYAKRQNDDFTYGKSESFILNYDYLYRWKKIKVNGIVEVDHINASGSSIVREKRDQASAILLISHDLTESLAYGVNLRKDWVSDYKSPFLFSVNGSYRPTEIYTLNFGASKNYRIPTFNDLYWEAVGNPNLLPETSLQAELGQSFVFSDFKFGLTGYYIASKDLIQWRPNASGVWSPINVHEVSQYGVELEGTFDKTFKKHRFSWKNGYAYTQSIDDLSQKQLIYVPLHRLTSNFSYRYKNMGLFFQGLYNGPVFTTSDNAQSLDGYLVCDMGLEYGLPKIGGIEITALLKMNNITNKDYQNVAYRPMPNRNIHLQFQFKF